jgi:hypothetical protein
MMLDSWETDGGYPANLQTPAPSLQWAKSLDYAAKANERMGNAIQSLSALGEVLRPLSEETAELLRPLVHLRDGDKIRLGIYSDLSQFICTPVNLKADGKYGAAIGFDANPRRWNERIPASRVSDDGKLIAPTTDMSVMILSAIWGDNRICFEDQAAKHVFDGLSMQWKLYFLCAEMQAKYKAEGTLAALAQSFPDPPGYKITPYQRVAAACASVVPGYGLWMKPGTGKTLTTIVAMDYLAKRHKQIELQRLTQDPNYTVRPYRVYITCPKDVRINWVAELKKFSTTRGKATIYEGCSLTRQKIMLQTVVAPSSITEGEFGYDWVAIIGSYGVQWRDAESLAKTAVRNFNGGVITEPLWDLMIEDESHYIKNGKSQQSKGAKKLRDASARRLALTGTPMPNSISDLYAQLEFLGAGYSGFKSLKQFNKFYKRIVEIEVQTGNAAFTVERGVGMLNAPLIKERIARYCFTITKEEALDLPPKLQSVVGVTMTPQQAAVYERALRSIVVEAENELNGSAGDGRNYRMLLNNVLKKMTRLTQITSGFYVTDKIVDDDGKVLALGEVHRFDPNPKLELLIEHCKRLPKESKCIIAACWKQDIRTISARLGIEGIDHVLYYGDIKSKQREINLGRFNTEQGIQFMVGNPRTFGIGRNILGHADEHTNADHVFIFSQGPRSDVREQLEDRINRMGTRVTSYYRDFIVPNTIDEQWRELVVNKRDVQISVQDVRGILGILNDGLTRLREAE